MVVGRGALLEKLKKRTISSANQAATTTRLDDLQPETRCQAPKLAESPPLLPVASLSSTTPITVSSSSNVEPESNAIGAAHCRQSPYDQGSLNFKSLSLGSKKSYSSNESTTLDHNKSPSAKERKFSRPVDVHVNLLKIKNRNLDAIVFLYGVKFHPPIESRGERFRVIRRIMSNINVPYFFSGTNLYAKQHFGAKHQVEGAIFDFIKELPVSDALTVNALALKEIFMNIGLVRLGKSFFDLSNPVKFEKYGLQIFSGYTVLVNTLSEGAYACLDVCNKVIRTDSVHAKLIELFKKYSTDTTRINAAVSEEIIGETVITRYNNKTYTVVDIDWDSNPMSEFEKGDSTKISFANYFKSTYPSVNLTDYEQPMLLVKGKGDNKVYLIPELCYLTGLTDSMRNDFSLMKSLAEKMKVSPQTRYTYYNKFCKLVYSSPKAREIFDTWQLDLDQTMTKCTGKLIDGLQVHFSSEDRPKSITIQNADFGNHVIREKPLKSVDLIDWAIVYNERCSSQVEDLISFMNEFSRGFQMRINNPIKATVHNDRVEHKLEAIKRLYHSKGERGLQIIVTIMEHKREDYYNVIKQLCYCELGIPSQVVVSKTLSNRNKVRSIVAKILLQINCKLGGQLWTLFKRIDTSSVRRMICGIDVFHQRGQPSVIGLVSSLDPLYSVWYSKASIHNQMQEISSKLEELFTDSLEQFRKQNSAYPKEIILYRDGVGQGRLNSLLEFEVEQIKRALNRVAPNPSDPIELTLVVVSKRINVRIFSQDNPTSNHKSSVIANSLPGTVLDRHVTKPRVNNFYLVPQSIRQGTATPTHYTVLLDESRMDMFELQKLTYELCYMYYNWPGSIRVPAPCQYAHRLAYMIGENLRRDVRKELQNDLFYL